VDQGPRCKLILVLSFQPVVPFSTPRSEQDNEPKEKETSLTHYSCAENYGFSDQGFLPLALR